MTYTETTKVTRIVNVTQGEATVLRACQLLMRYEGTAYMSRSTKIVCIQMLRAYADNYHKQLGLRDAKCIIDALYDGTLQINVDPNS